MELIRPNNRYLDSYIEASNEYDLYSLNVEVLFDSPETVIQKSIDYENGVNMKPGYVRATTFWLIDNHEFIGEINIRHELNDNLLRYGGHIGYGIRSSMRNKGYGTKMLQMALVYCKETLKINRVLVTCDENNICSRRVIEKNSGILENIIINYTERGIVKTRRYWIDL
ncbi:MAG TPA: GNAT family N-acetyltransferase [Erysipelotrichaceae bacterium]|nr:GNAT family N-acetyltransferase [Erysipelotrichaceae bacterium]